MKRSVWPQVKECVCPKRDNNWQNLKNGIFKADQLLWSLCITGITSKDGNISPGWLCSIQAGVLEPPKLKRSNRRNKKQTHVHTTILLCWKIFKDRNITSMIIYVQDEFLQPPHATNNTDVAIKKGNQNPLRTFKKQNWKCCRLVWVCSWTVKTFPLKWLNFYSPKVLFFLFPVRYSLANYQYPISLSLPISNKYNNNYLVYCILIPKYLMAIFC
jgi:hypothetical protein